MATIAYVIWLVTNRQYQEIVIFHLCQIKDCLIIDCICSTSSLVKLKIKLRWQNYLLKLINRTSQWTTALTNGLIQNQIPKFSTKQTLSLIKSIKWTNQQLSKKLYLQFHPQTILIKDNLVLLTFWIETICLNKITILQLLQICQFVQNLLVCITPKDSRL